MRLKGRENKITAFFYAITATLLYITSWEKQMYYPDLAEFKRQAEKATVIPVYRELLADLETPVSAFRKIDDGRYSFLLESVEGGEKWGRYSFLGINPSVIFRVQGSQVSVEENGKKTSFPHQGDPLGLPQKIDGAAIVR